jgi:choline-sulfatase
MTPANLLIIMVDEMSAKTVGCYGHPIVKTPNIDRLAERGVRFTNAYATSPICVPARASFATGQYPHRTGYWDNVFAYDGRVKGWGHRLQETGHRFTTIGKLHYLDAAVPTGIDEQILPMHLFGGGDIFGLEREDPPERPQSSALAAEVATGDSGYTRYDKQITELTEDWLRDRAGEQGNKPWVTFTSYIAPHFPLTVPQPYLDLYADAEIELLGKSLVTDGALGRWWRLFRNGYNFDDYFRDDTHRKEALRHYYALCSFADDNVGRVLRALEASAEADRTRILFLSDHGDNLGARGLWGKSTMYEESVKVPMILAGPGIPEGEVCGTPVALVDAYPTVLDAVGIAPSAQDRALPGRSLLRIATEADDADRQVFAEYHASCAPTGLMMLRRGRYKYIHYTGYGDQLFDLEADPEEIEDLAGYATLAPVVKRFQAALRAICDPQEVDRRAKADQRRRLAELGGMDRIVARGGVPHTPAPGEEPSFVA